VANEGNRDQLSEEWWNRGLVIGLSWSAMTWMMEWLRRDTAHPLCCCFTVRRLRKDDCFQCGSHSGTCYVFIGVHVVSYLSTERLRRGMVRCEDS